MVKPEFMNRSFPYILLLALSVFAIVPFLNSGFFIIHDNTQVQRTFEMAKSLGDGMLPVRWVSDLGYGYGYPIFNFYAPAFYYLSGFLTLMGLEALLSTKLTAILTVFLSGVSMYLLARQFWGKWGGVLSAVLYTYTPFHAVDIYVRGAFAEALAYGILPLPFLGLYKIYKEDSKEKLLFWTVITSFSFSLLILSHNLSAFMVAPFLVIFAIILSSVYFRNNRKLPLHMFYSLVLGIILPAFYWIPALAELKFTDVYSIVGGGSDFRDHFVCLTQFWYSPWGYAGSAPGCVDGISFELGKIHVLIVLVASMGLFLIRKNTPQFFSLLLALALFIFSIFLMTDYSRVVWETILPMKFFQFPWRFLLLSSFSMSFVGGFIFWFVSKKIVQDKFILVVLLAVVIGLVFYYQKIFYPQSMTSDPSRNYTNEKSLKWFTSRISDEYMPRGFPVPAREDDIPTEKIMIDANGEIRRLTSDSSRLDAIIRLDDKSAVYLNIANFPAWNFYLDGKRVVPQESFGIYVLNVSEGDHKIEAIFKQTPIEKTSNLISLLGLAVLFVGIISLRRNYGK